MSRFEILLWSKSKMNFVIKWKIFIYFSQSTSTPSNTPLLDPNAFVPTFPPVFEACWKVVCRFSLQYSFRFPFDLFNRLKRFPRSGLLSFGNSLRSHGAKSGEYGGCEAKCVEFLAKNEESRQCATVHYRGAKFKSCWPIISVSFCE